MSNYWNNQLMLPAPELIQTMNGTDRLIGFLLHNPVKLIFDNLSTVTIIVYLSFDGGTTKIRWKTFQAGTALVLDDDLFTFPKNTYFYGNGASGDFSIAYCYTKE